MKRILEIDLHELFTTTGAPAAFKSQNSHVTNSTTTERNSLGKRFFLFLGEEVFKAQTRHFPGTTRAVSYRYAPENRIFVGIQINSN